MDTAGSLELGVFKTTATQEHALGRRVELWDGRVFRYCKNGEAQIGAALMTQSSVAPAETINIEQVGQAMTAGDKTVRVLVTTSNGVVDGGLIGGTLLIRANTGERYAYAIKNNKWIIGDTVMELELYDAIRVTTDETTKITLFPNRYKDVIVAPTTLTGAVVGVTNLVIPANHYFWAQTRGLAPMLVDADDTLVIGEKAGFPATAGTAGAVGVVGATDVVYGHVVAIGADGETALIDLRLE